MMFDRGAFERLEFQKCARGFVLYSGGRYEGGIGQTFAFDRVEDVAAWLVEQYRPSAPETCKHEGGIVCDANKTEGCCIACGAPIEMEPLAR